VAYLLGGAARSGWHPGQLCRLLLWSSRRDGFYQGSIAGQRGRVFHQLEGRDGKRGDDAGDKEWENYFGLYVFGITAGLLPRWEMFPKQNWPYRRAGLLVIGLFSSTFSLPP